MPTPFRRIGQGLGRTGELGVPKGTLRRRSPALLFRAPASAPDGFLSYHLAVAGAFQFSGRLIGDTVDSSRSALTRDRLPSRDGMLIGASCLAVSTEEARLKQRVPRAARQNIDRPGIRGCGDVHCHQSRIRAHKEERQSVLPPARFRASLLRVRTGSR